MSSHRITRTLAALVAASVLVSCGDSSMLDKYGGGREGKRAAAQARPGADKGRAAQRSADAARTGAATKAAASRTAPNAQADPRPRSRDGSGTASTGSAAVEQQRAAAARSCADDLRGDLDGSRSAPAWSDLTGGCAAEDGDRVVLTATTAGSLPARMPDRGSNFAVGFELDTGAGKPWYVAAEATASGWSAYASRGGQRRSLPGPTISGDRLTLSIPAAQVGAGTIQWLVESSWLRSTLTSTSYSFDDAPNGRAATLRR